MTSNRPRAIATIFALVVSVIWVTTVFGDSYTISDGSLLVIVNKDNPVSELTQSDLEKIFLGKRSFWKGGRIIKRCDLVEVDIEEDDTARAIFSVAYLHKDLMTLKSYWIKMIFSGRGQPPVSFSRPEDVINFVAKNPGGIGYIRPDDPTGKIKVIEIAGATD